MPKVFVSRSISIAKPAEEILPQINNFRNWVHWSPWLRMEPDAKLNYAEDNRSYTWEGKRVGAGNMQIRSEKGSEEIHFDLNFTKPWKSANKTSLYLKEQNGHTQVTWTMDSSLPLFMFWMKKSMEAFIGADYERGLDMLKALTEKGHIPSKLEWPGKKHFEGCTWMGVNTTCAIPATEQEMPKDFGKIWAWAAENEALVAGKGMTIYHKWDVVKNTVSYTAAIPVKELPNPLPQGFVSGAIPATEAFVLRHIGAYQHLGNAWSTLYSMHRNKEFKHNKKIDPFEIYQNNPSDTAPEALITDIYFPLK